MRRMNARSCQVIFLRQSSNLWGPEKCILGLCRALPKHGFPCEIAIMYRRKPDEPAEHPMVAAARAQNTPITQLNGHLNAFPGAVRWIRRKLQGHKLSILHANEYKTDLLAALAAGKRRSAVLVATVRHTEPSLQMAIFEGLDSFVLHRFHRLTTPSQGALQELKHWPSLLRRTSVIHHAVDLDADSKDGPVADLHPRNGHGPVISIVGRLQTVKGHRIFLESARQVLAQRPDARFWIVGEGELREKLEAASFRLGLANAVSFLGYRNDVDTLMASSDVVVCASSYESLSRSTLEALALNRPVVAPSVGGIPEIIRDGETGLLVPAGDPGAMASGILRLLNDRDFAQRLGTAGRKFVGEHFTWETQASALAGLYREVLACR
jgi:glycosyltransferase involved in cell wall biosynthesis